MPNNTVRKVATSVPARLPRFIENLNELARRYGMTVDVAVEPYSNDSILRFLAKWRGTREQFLALVQPVPSYRLPLTCGSLNIPGGSGYYAPNALISGQVTVSGDQVLFEVDFGPPDFSIANLAGAEVISYAEEVLYHGMPDSLVALGIERSRLPLGKRTTKRYRAWDAGEENWRSRRQPDGSIVHRVESPSALRLRRKEYEEYCRKAVGRTPGLTVQQTPLRPSHIRLVIDNTGRGGAAEEKQND